MTYSTKWTREDFERPSYLTGNFFHNLARKWPVHPAYDPNGFPMDEGEVEQMENGGKQNSQKDFYTNQLQLVSNLLKTGKSILTVVYVPLLNISIGKYCLFMLIM